MRPKDKFLIIIFFAILLAAVVLRAWQTWKLVQ